MTSVKAPSPAMTEELPATLLVDITLIQAFVVEPPTEASGYPKIRDKSEASRMEKHGTSLNAGFHYGYWNQYLPLKFRPAVLEGALVQVLATIAHDNVLVSNLDALRAAAAAADSETDRVLQDGRLVLDRLRPFVLQVVSNASQVVSGIDRILGPTK